MAFSSAEMLQGIGYNLMPDYHLCESMKTQIELSLLTCVVRIMLYRSSLGAGIGAGIGAGFFTIESCLKLPLNLLTFGFGGILFSFSALWSSMRRAWLVATSSKNSSLCSEFMEEKITVGNGE